MRMVLVTGEVISRELAREAAEAGIEAIFRKLDGMNSMLLHITRASRHLLPPDRSPLEDAEAD